METLILGYINECGGADVKRVQKPCFNRDSFYILVFINIDAAAQRLGILYQPAPSRGISEWFQLPAGKTTLDIDDFKGNVNYLYCFQNGCPGCHSHGVRLLQKLTRHYKDNDSVAFVAVQTTFEGFLQTPLKALKKLPGVII